MMVSFALMLGNWVVEGTVPWSWLFVAAGLGAAFVALLLLQSLTVQRLQPALLTGLQRAFMQQWQKAAARDEAQSSVASVGRSLVLGQRETRWVVDYVFRFVPARYDLSLMPLFVLALVAVLHWPTALLLTVAVPVMVVFLAFVGRNIADRAKEEQAAVHAFADTFLDRVRCLPTLVSLGWGKAASERLADQARDYERSAFAVMKVAFLNSAVLDFFASISVAVVAVFFGLGHLGLATFPGFGAPSLAVSLPVLVLAVEFFQPFRRLSAEYHLKAKGEAAMDALAAELTPAHTDEEELPMNTFAQLGHFKLPLIDKPVALQLPEQGLVAIVGPSGAGKSLLLDVLFGVREPAEGQPEPLAQNRLLVDGQTRIDDADFALAETALGRALLPEFRAKQATRQTLSGGQHQRLALLKALEAAPPVLGLDEPTAKLDEDKARLVRQALRRFATNKLVLTATHDQALIDAADWVCDLSQPLVQLRPAKGFVAAQEAA